MQDFRLNKEKFTFPFLYDLGDFFFDKREFCLFLVIGLDEV